MAHLLAAILYLSILIMGCTPTMETIDPEVETISPDRLIQMAEEGIRIIDVRTPEETATGIIQYAELIDFNGPNFEWAIGMLDRSLPVVVYCESGIRSAKAAELLLEAGFAHVYTLEGGVLAWKSAGYDVSAP